MLALDDPRWTELHDAYGPAESIPALLARLAKSPAPALGARDEPWFTLWSSLCHQDDVYTASYAALPHIVSIGLDASGPIDFSFFQLPASIEVSRFKGRGPEVPAYLGGAYRAGISMLMDCASAHRSDPWDRAMALSIAAAQAVAKGLYVEAEAIMNLDDDWILKINASHWD